MISYGPLARIYDKLTTDIDYNFFMNFYKTKFSEYGGEFRLVLDLCCGTGTLSKMMHDSNYDIIGVDSSPDMLMEAKNKCPDILFLCQDAAELDLYGTVDACYSSLDSMNYISHEDISKVFERLHLFIRPGGIFIFDIKDIKWMESMNDYISVDENDDILCLWRGEYNNNILHYYMDIFTKKGNLWKRDFEEHTEYAHDCEKIKELLDQTGFTLLDITRHEERLFISAKRN